TTQTDNLSIGTTTPDSRSVVTVGATSTTANLLTLKMVQNQTGNPFVITNSASSTLSYFNSQGYLGIATSTSINNYGLNVSANTYLDSNLITIGSSTAPSLTVSYLKNATTTVLEGQQNTFNFSTSTVAEAIPFFSLSTLQSVGLGESASTTSSGRLGLGTTTPEARLSIQGLTKAQFGVAGIHEILTADPSAGGTQFGNRLINYNSPTRTPNTFVGEFVRIIDNSGLANTVLGLEIQTHSGTTTAGTITGLRATGKTFGVQGVTTATAAGVLNPAGVYAENQASTTGNALRVYSATSTVADLALFYTEGAQNFTGSGLKMNFANGTGAFTGSFLKFQVAGESKLVATSTGTIGIGTTSPLQGVVSTHRGLVIESGALTAGSGTPMLWLGTSDTGAQDKAFISAYSAVTGSPDLEFMVSSNGNVKADGTITAGSADVAEWFPAKNNKAVLEAGDLVSVDGSTTTDLVKKSEGVPYDPKVVGIISTKPGLIAGGGNIEDSHNSDVMVALVGRVPVKISDENGPVKPGDRLTSSSIPGIAMKATSSGMTVGVALESFNDGSNYLSEGVRGVETNIITTEEITKVNKTVARDNTYQGGDAEEAKTRKGGIIQTIIETLIPSLRTESVEPAAEPVKTMTAPGGGEVKVGKILLFVNLAHIQADASLAALSEGGTAAPDGTQTTNAWAVDMTTGKVSVNFFGDINLQGNRILDAAKISGVYGNWSIDENGKIIAKEIEVGKATVKDELNVGSKEKPTGITIYDEATGEPFCIKVVNGAMVSMAGKCNLAVPPPSEPDPTSDVGAESAPTPTPEPVASPTTEPLQSGDDATAGQATPTPISTPTPIPEPTIAPDSEPTPVPTAEPTQTPVPTILEETAPAPEPTL
ncbi:MAG: hypothetical protein UW30_C0012G0001, partial [Candidatus Giovannonibacteria bacterium GW2011_GWA2_44_13b]